MMRSRPVISLALALAPLLLFAFCGTAFGQVVLPWQQVEKPPTSPSPAVEEARLPLAQAHLDEGGTAWVGQAVPLTVEVIVPTWFTAAPKFPELDIPNAVVLSPEGAVNFSVPSGGKTFAGQSRRYLIFPQVKGTLIVPSVNVEVTYALPDGKPSPPRLIAAPSVRLAVRVPPGAERAKYFLTAESFQVSQSLDRKTDNLRVGDVVTRTVTMTAKNTAGIGLPPLAFEAPRGITLYPGTPKVTEAAERGELEATRTESAAYVPEQEGRYTIPEITILWWNPRTKAMNRATLPALVLQVQAGPAYGTERFTSSQADAGPAGKNSAAGTGERIRAWLHRSLALLAAILVFLVARRILAANGRSLRSVLAERRRRRTSSEAACFARFRKASLANDPEAAVTRLMRWLDRAYPGPTVPTLRRFTDASGMPELAEATRKLEDLVFGPQAAAKQPQARTAWSGKPLYALVARARKLHIRKHSRKRRTAALASINEGGD